MTWIVGGNGMFYPFIAGDVRVTFRLNDGRTVERDCLQKIHHLSRNILVGFSGSVRGSFGVLGFVARQLRPDHWYSLPRLAHTWMPRTMRFAFQMLPESERDLGVQLLMVGAHPQLTRGPFGPRADTFRFRSPLFEPECTKGAECFGIGSGNSVEKYRKAAEELSHEFFLHQTATMGLLGPASTFAMTLHKIVKDDPQPGVSPWFLFGTVSLTEAHINAIGYTEYAVGEPTQHSVPPVATSYSQFVALAKQEGLLAEAASASSRRDVSDPQ